MSIHNYFKLEECKDFKELESACLPLTEAKETWVFRGQENAKWSLETTFTRACDLCALPKEKRVTCEGLMRREFRRRTHQYINNPPRASHTDEWLALMQHYGAPTRLLDFTYSPYVAMFFAFEKAAPSSDVAIWAFNTTWNEAGLKRFSKPLAAAYSEYQNNRDWEKFSQVLKKSSIPKSYILNFNPFRLNERLTYQRGLFLYQGDVSLRLDQNILDFTDIKINKEKGFIKFKVHNDEQGKTRTEALKRLDCMNITRATLFPDFEGFASSFSSRIPTLFMKQSETILDYDYDLSNPNTNF